jgi:hypothetical protein
MRGQHRRIRGGERGTPYQDEPCHHDCVEIMAGTPFVANTTTSVTRDAPEPERLPCQRCDLLKQEPAVVMGDSKECRASARGWRRSCGDRGIHRAGEHATRVGESSRRNWYVRFKGYADQVSLVKMREFRRNYLHHGRSKTLVFGTAERIRQSTRKIDFSALDHERGF